MYIINILRRHLGLVLITGLDL